MRIISDTACHLSVEEAKQADVILVANQVSIEDRNYRDYLEIDSMAFVQLLETGIARTSQPSVGDVMEAYDACVGEPTIHLTVGQGLSSAFESAQGVKHEMNAEHVRIFDTRSLAGPNRYLTLLASRLVKNAGYSIDQILEKLSKCAQESQSYVIPVSFEFLKRSGRLTPLAAKLGGYFQIKPIMSQSEDRQRIEKFGIERSWNHAIESIVLDLVKHQVDSRYRIYVAHAFNRKAVLLAISVIRKHIANADIEQLLLAPSMITHGGPGCLVIQYILKDPIDR